LFEVQEIGAATCRTFPDGAYALKIPMLLHHRQAYSGLPRNGSEGRLGGSSQEIEQRGFAGAVPAEHAPAFTFRNREGDAGEEGCRPESDAEVGC
jgi:hypothetical protein